MPLKNKKTDSTNGLRKSGGKLKLIFKRYNPDKITIDGIKNFFGFVFYKVGYNVEINFDIVYRQCRKVFDNIYKAVDRFMKKVSVFLDKLTDTILDDLGEPLKRLGRAYNALTTIKKEAKTDNNRSARKEMGAYVKSGMEKHKDLAQILYSYAVPAACGLIFAVVVSVGLNREYVINVLVDGKNIGTISNYNILENANKIIENKLVSTDEQTWTLDSAIKMVNKGKKNVMDERQLANAILENSSENIVEATGLYVDGDFAGAVKDATYLNKALEELKEPYENGDENRKVSFVEDVSVMDGIFFTDSVVPDKELAEMVGSEVSGAKYYTVQSGDSKWKISRANGITQATLEALNPEKDWNGLWPGEQLVVSASVPFLQVKYVETGTRQVEIAYKTKTEKNNSMTLGTSKTTVKGQKGLNEEVYERTYIDGVLQSEVVVKTTVLKEPVTEVIQQGTLWNGTVIQGGNGRLIWPTGGGRVSRGFAGQYPAHNGVDIAGPIGTHIYAADSGVVTKALYTNRGYGVYLIVEHGGYQTLYGHCSRLLVGVGQQVTQGQVIAYMGSTGNSTGPHLHFEVKRGSYRYDPYGWF